MAASERLMRSPCCRALYAGESKSSDGKSGVPGGVNSLHGSSKTTWVLHSCSLVPNFSLHPKYDATWKLHVNEALKLGHCQLPNILYV